MMRELRAKRRSVSSKVRWTRWHSVERLEHRWLFSIGGEPSLTDPAVIEEYGQALFGKEWQQLTGVTVEGVQDAIAEDTWRDYLNGNENSVVAFVRQTAVYLGPKESQKVLDEALEPRGLKSPTIAHFDWFESPAEVTDAHGLPIKPSDIAQVGGALAAAMSMSCSPVPLSGDIKVENLNDGSEGGTVAIRETEVTVNEGDAFAVVHVRYTGAEWGDGFTLDYYTEDDSATHLPQAGGQPSDYNETMGCLNWSDGGEGYERAISVPINNDTLVETSPNPEKFYFKLDPASFTLNHPGNDNAEGDPSLGNTNCTINILDNDVNDPPGILISDATVIEGNPGDNRQIAFNVSLNRATTQTVSVQFSTADGTAIGGSPGPDYTSKFATVTWNPSDPLSQIVYVEITEDVTPETNEDFYANLTSPVNAYLVDDQGVGTIYDDDSYIAYDGMPGGAPGGGDNQPTPPPPNPPCDCGPEQIDPSSNTGSNVIDQMLGGPADGYSPSLSYDSMHNPHPIIKLDVFVPPASTSNKVLLGATAALTLNGVAVPAPMSPMYFGSLTGLAQGAPVRFVMQADATSLSSGTYDWSMEVTYDYAVPAGGGTFTNHETRVATYFGKESLINRTGSEFGRGWWMNGLDQIVERTDGVTLVLGSGYAAFFKKVGNSFVTPGAYFSTLVKNLDNTYTLTQPNGSSDKFAVAVGGVARVAERRDRLNNLTSYSYSSPSNRLSTITDPNGNTWTFNYDGGGKLSTVTDRAGRVTNVTITSDKLTSITTPDPDGIPGNGVNPLVSSYSYNAQNRLSQINQVSGEVTKFFYEATSGRLDYLEHADTKRQLFDAYQASGLPNYASGQGTTPSTAAPFIAPSDAVANWTNEELELSTSKMDRYGFSTYEKDGLGNVTQIERFSNGLPKKVTSPDPDDYTATGGSNGPRLPLVVEYTWDAKGNMLTRTENTTAVETWTYDAVFSQVTSYTDQLQRRTEFTVDPSTGNVTQRHQIMDVSPGPTDLITSYTYTVAADGVPAGLPKTIADAENRVTRFEYYTDTGRKGLLKKVIVAEDTTDQADLEYDYDAVTRDLVLSKDELDRVTTYQYDALYRLKKVTQPDPDGLGVQTQPEWLYTYCNCGNIDTITDPELNVTDYDFDDRNQLWKITLPEPSAGAGHPIIEYQYDDAERMISVAMPDPDGPSLPKLPAVTSYTYDDRGLVTHVTLADPDGNGMQQRPDWTLAYDRAGLLISQKDPMQFETNFEYDNRHRLKKTIQPPATVGGVRPTWEYFYDAAGQVTNVVDPRFATTSFGYDRAGRLNAVLEADPDGSSNPGLSPQTFYNYDKVGNLRYDQHLLDSSYVVNKELQYDSRNRLKVVIEPDPDGSIGGPKVSPITSYSYDAVGNLKTITDPAGNVTTWFYDDLDRVVQEKNHLNASRFFAYDKVGNVTQKTDRNSRVINYTYDDLYRKTLEQSAGFSSTVYSYDLASRLTLGTNSAASYLYDFDDLGRVKSTTATANVGSTVVLAATFDPNSRRTSLSATTGSTADFVNEYEYDQINRLTVLKQRGVSGGRAVADKRINFDYDLAGNVQGIDRFRDLTATQLVIDGLYENDLLGRRTGALYTPTGAGAPAISLDITFDRLSRVTSFWHLSDGSQSTYTLDDLGQVIASATPPAFADESYAFDPAGNRTQDGTTNYVVTANNRLQSDGVDTYLYDGEGNRIRKTHVVNGSTTIYTNYSYDHRNRLTKAIDRLNDPSTGAIQKQVQYTYDAFDRRAARLLDENGDNTFERVERYIYDGDNVVLEWIDPAGSAPLALRKRYLYGPAVDQILAQEDQDAAIGSNNRVLWFLEDHQGSTRDLVDNGGNVVAHYVYDAFGEVVAGDTSKTRYLYTGRELDTATGLQYNHHRWYDPHTGRWVSEDPIGFRGWDYNLNRYVANMATYARDPSGLEDFIVNDFGDNADLTNRLHRWISRPYPGTGIDASSVDDAVDQILENLGPDDEIDSIQFWGHGGPGRMMVGGGSGLSNSDQEINSDSFTSDSPLGKLRGRLSPDCKITFKGCDVFTGEKGRQFAKDAAEFFDCTVAGHNAPIPQGILNYPGYQELEPGETPSWKDGSGRHDKTQKPKPKNKPPKNKSESCDE